MEALGRREAEFRQQQEREHEQARDAQVKLRELAAKELKERVHLERELVKQQQQNVILQKATLAPVREEMATPSPKIVELTEPDTPPSS